MTIELLSIAGCPHRDLARRLVTNRKPKTVNREPKPRFTVYGSRFTLSIRIDGVDVEPSARTSEQFGLTCRTYREGRRLQGAPSQELIERALREERND